MTFLRRCPSILLVVVLLFAVGHAHQAFGRFLVHHHDAAAAQAHHPHDGTDPDHLPDQHDQQDAEHMAEHAAFAAIVPSLDVPMAIELHLLAAVNVAPARGFEPLAVGIDHPPQLLA